MGSPEEGERFFDEHWPEARAVSDESKELYAGLGLTRGSLGQLMGTRVLRAGWRSMLGGHGAGKPIGDVRMLSGSFLVQGERVLWQHVHEHAGDDPRFEQARAAWLAQRADSDEAAPKS